MESWYHRKYRWIKARPAVGRLLMLACKGLTAAIYAAYILLLAFALLRLPLGRFLRVMGVPAAAFLLGTALRAYLNKPRPYEVMALPPISKKDTRGQSFPSRHVFCAAVISMAFGYVWPPLGMVFGLAAVAIAVLRVLLGVHWIKDVLAGLAFGWGMGILGFWLL